MKRLNSDSTMKIKKEKTMLFTATTTFTPEREIEHLTERFLSSTKKLIRTKWYRIFKRAKLIRDINFCVKRIKELKKLIKK